MTKLREIADKLGLPIGKVFKIDNIKSLVFRIDDKGNVLFYHEEKEIWVKSAWDLLDVYVLGYTLIDWIKPKKEVNKDEEYYEKVRLSLIVYHDLIVEALKETKDIIRLSSLKEEKWKVFDLINATQERLLNK